MIIEAILEWISQQTPSEQEKFKPALISIKKIETEPPTPSPVV